MCEPVVNHRASVHKLCWILPVSAQRPSASCEELMGFRSDWLYEKSVSMLKWGEKFGEVSCGRGGRSRTQHGNTERGISVLLMRITIKTGERHLS